MRALRSFLAIHKADVIMYISHQLSTANIFLLLPWKSGEMFVKA